ncbi:MAG: hypothetical protein KDA60_18905, partial [Planctomycetales bacterium]|nr:hypothetical protein [Planctomycetales bacterium]
MSASDATSKIREQFFQNIRQATEANLKLQQEAVRQWSSLWPTTMPKTAWTDTVRDFQKKWTDTVTDLTKKHREVIDRQYDAAIASMEAALD